MTERGRSEQPVSVAQIAADDRLLDALARGEPLDGDLADDPAATMLAAWRADLDDEDAWDDVPVSPAPVAAGDPRRKRRLVQATLGAAAAAVVAVGFAVSAHQAQPGSVLWPVSKVVYPQRAEVVAAQKAIADARTALAEGRTADARALLATAAEHIARIDDSDTAARLRAEVDALLRDLTAATTPPNAATAPTPSTKAPAPHTSPSRPSGGSGANPDRTPEGGNPAPAPSESSGGGLLPLPTPLLPPLPLPTLPPILPGGD